MPAVPLCPLQQDPQPGHADMRVERPPAPFGQNAEIAARLRRLDHAEARLAAGNGEVEVRLGDDLQKDTGVRPALVGLSG